MSDFVQTHAVVTGASSGIGRSVAIALASAGVKHLVVHYRSNRDGAEQTATKVRAVGCEATTIAGDLANPSDRQRLVSQSFQVLGTIQTWVNNAGADVLTGDAADLDFDAKLEHLLSVDVVGTIVLSRLVADKLQLQSDALPPSMVFVGWDQALYGMEGDAGQMFGPVKAAVMAFAKSLAQSVSPQIRVNTIAPGWIQTAWGQATSEYWDQRAKRQSLMNRWGKPEDIAKAVLYAADPGNTFLTGQTIQLNGGWNRKPEG